MIYSEANDFLLTHLDPLNSETFFKLYEKNCMFLGLIVAPSNIDKELIQIMYDKNIKNNVSAYDFLSEKGILNEDMNVFLIYKTGGENLITTLDNYLDP